MVRQECCNLFCSDISNRLLLLVPGNYSSKADCWSVGVIAYVLLSQKKPFASKSRSQTINKITKCKYNFDADIWRGISQEAKNFVSSLIVYDPFDRLSAEQALDHPWLKNNATKNKAATSADFRRQASLMNHIHDSILGYGRMSELRRIASVIVAHKSSAGTSYLSLLGMSLISLLHNFGFILL
jgi:calcium-dependent protein kinase